MSSEQPAPQSPGPDASTEGAQRHWLDSDLGLSLLEAEEAQVKAALQQVFGLQLLQVGIWGAAERFVQHSKTLRHGVLAAADAPGVDVIGRAEELPIASDSVDAVLLPHTLERSSHPHQTLREVHRVLVGEGHLLILGFSPYSLFGMRQKTLAAWRLGARRDMLSERRLRDWLRLLGLDLVDCQKYFYSLPVNSKKVLQKSSMITNMSQRYLRFSNGAYLLVAKKSLHRAATVGPRWHMRRSVVGGLAGNTSRSAQGVKRQEK